MTWIRICGWKIHAAMCWRRMTTARAVSIRVSGRSEGNVYGSASNAIVQLLALMFYLFADGRVYSADELKGLLAETGFKQPQVTKMRQSPGSSLITAVS
jgi:hypothetical protein